MQNEKTEKIRWKQREEENTDDGVDQLSVLNIRRLTIPQNEQELVLSCQRQHTTSLACQTSTSDNLPHLIRSIFPEKQSSVAQFHVLY